MTTSENKIFLREIARKREKALEELDENITVETKTVFFDSIHYTTDKAICFKKGDKLAWVARKVILEADLKNEPKSISVFDWVDVSFLTQTELANRNKEKQK